MRNPRTLMDIIFKPFISKDMSKHVIGEISRLPFSKPLSNKKAWKIRRQHGTGRNK